MVTVTNYKVVVTEDDETYIRLLLTGDISLVKSQATGRHYATVRKCSISSTFDEATAKLMMANSELC